MRQLLRALSLAQTLLNMFETIPYVYAQLKPEFDDLQAKIRDLAARDKQVALFKFYFDKAEVKVRKILNKKFG